jgi:hypothetical protein
LNLGYDENLNKSELFEQSEAVYYRGLSLKLFAGVFDSLFTDFFNFYENFGIAVSVDNQTDIPLADTRFFLLDTGFTHFFGMRKSVTKNLPSPFSECVDTTTYTSELQNELALQKIKYSKHNCVLLCHQKYVKDICDCYNPASIPLKETRPCLGDRDINCTFRACENFNINVQCNSQTCPDECEKVDYQFSRSSIVIIFVLIYCTFEPSHMFIFSSFQARVFTTLSGKRTRELSSFLDKQTSRRIKSHMIDLDRALSVSHSTLRAWT